MNAKADSAPLTLGTDQQRVTDRLQRRATLQLNALAAIDLQPEQIRQGNTGGGANPLKSPRQSNCIGIFGCRGSGKTTVLLELLRRLRDKHKDWHVLDRPLDLSLAPREFPHGLTVMHWLNEVIQTENSRHAHTPAVRKAFERVSQSYFRGSDGFNRLVRELAVSPEHYANAAAKEISLRLSLWVDIAQWLDAAARALGINGFIVAVDDLDLAPANRHQSLIWSLLDELHQPRLCFVLVADLPRLERRLAEEDAFSRRAEDGKSEPDFQAAHDLTYKVLPQVDRAELEPWPRKGRGDFPPQASATSTLATAATTKTKTKTKAKDKHQTIGGLAKSLGLPPVVRAHLDSLLPEWPRGLENVLREFQQLTRDQAENKDIEDVRVRTGQDLMGFLAESSFDFKLARKLRERNLADWAPSFAWAKASATLEATWDAIRPVLKATDSPQLADADLPQLLPEQGSSPLQLGLERARWAEVLLDVALAEGKLSAVRAIGRIPWLEARAASCQIELQRTADSVDRTVEDDPKGLLAALFWLRWPSKSGAVIGVYSVGFWPVLQLLGSDRKLWPRSMEKETWSPQTLARFVQELELRKQLLAERYEDKTNRLLPPNMRDLLRLVDELAKQPWFALADIEAQVGPAGMARLAATLSYHAYRSTSGRLKSADEGATRDMVELLNGASYGPQGLNEERIRTSFGLVAAQANAEREALKAKLPRPLSALEDSLLNFLEAPWFEGLA